jgi:uncharacterized protein
MPHGVNTVPASSAPCVGIGWRQPHYAELLERQPELGFLEVHSENFFASGGAALAVLQRGRREYPISLHGVGLSLGSVGGLDTWHLDQLANLVARIDPVRVSDHACFARGQLQGAKVHAADLLPLPFTDEALNVLCTHVHQVQERFKRPFMVENLSSYLTWRMPDAGHSWTEATFLAELARRTGCALLVDVNNIYVNALNGQKAGRIGDPMQNCKDWIDAIPLSVVGEMHLAGHCHVADEHGDIVIDDHGSRVCDEVWALYRYAVGRFGNVPTLLEWDTTVPTLDVLLDEASLATAVCQECTVGALA